MASQAPVTPDTSFAEHVEQPPEAMLASGGGTGQKVELFAKGASIGWLGQDSGEWCVVVGKDAAVSIEAYVWKDVLYYRNAENDARYLSVSATYNHVGFYNWSWGATGWTKSGDVLTSLYSNAQLSIWSTDDRYVYANGGSGYTPVTVQFH